MRSTPALSCLCAALMLLAGCIAPYEAQPESAGDSDGGVLPGGPSEGEPVPTPQEPDGGTGLVPGAPDAGGRDAGLLPPTPDAGPDAGPLPEGPDAGVDAGTPDAGVDAGTPDAGVDAGTPDAGVDAGTPDAGVDAGTPDAGVDAGVPDGGTPSGLVPRTDILLQGRAFRAYRWPEDTFRIVCEEPCPLEESYLRARHEGFAAVKAELVARAGMDVLPELAPVDLHVTGDSLCGPAMPNIAGTAFLLWDGSQPLNAHVCLWDLEASQLPPPYVPRSLTPEAARSRQAQILPVHEYGHTLFFKRHEFSPEWFARALSFRVAGDITDLCDRQMSFLGKTAYELCQRNGMRWEHLSAALAGLDALYQSDGGTEEMHVGLRTTTGYQLRTLIAQQVGSDTFEACVAGGELHPNQCGDAAVLPAGAATVSMYGGRVTWELPAGALAAPVTLSPGTWRSGMAVAPEWNTFHWLNNYAFLPAENTFAAPVRLTVRYDPALIPAGGNEASLALYEMYRYPYLPVPDSQVDVERHQVSGTVSRLGRYIVAPR